MKIIKIFIILLLFVSCKTIENKKLPLIQAEKINFLSLPLIDNFENPFPFWKLVVGENSDGKFLIESQENNRIGVLYYKVPFSNEEFPPYYVGILYEREFNFTNFKGIMFYAYSDNQDINLKLKLYESEIFNNENKIEIWYKKIKLNSKLELYKINFNEFIVEEFYEQNYVSDNIMNLEKIIGVGIFIENNNRYNDLLSGKLYIDDIKLF